MVAAGDLTCRNHNGAVRHGPDTTQIREKETRRTETGASVNDRHRIWNLLTCYSSFGPCLRIIDIKFNYYLL